MYERRPGVWLIRVYAGIDPVTGKRLRVSETFEGTRKEATQHKAKMIATHTTSVRTGATLWNIIVAWRDARTHARSTMKTYDNALRLLPQRLRDTRADKVTTQDIDRLYAHLLRNGESVDTVRTLHANLNAAYNQAVRWGHLSENPVARAEQPPKPKRRIVLPPMTAVERLMQAVAGDTEMTLWLRLMMASGCRRGESLALRWNDVDFESGQVQFSRTVDNAGHEELRTKTGEPRIVPLDSETMRLFWKWRAEQVDRAGGKVVRNARVFSPEVDGSNPYRGDSMYRRFKKLAEKAGVKASPHKLRHLMVSIALDAGESLEAVSRRVGHSRTSVTTDVYSHMIHGADRRIGDSIGQLMPMPQRAS